jgi:predicted short-subunit dehydrogenase-like oxidoreductase (DUF2520 family)
VDHPHPARLRVGVIGTGRVGAVLGAALARAGHHVVAVSGVSDASVQRAARMLPGVPRKDPPAVLADADLVLLTVPDDALPDLVAGLAATDAPGRGGCSRTPAAGTAPRCSTPSPGAARCRWRCTR